MRSYGNAGESTTPGFNRVCECLSVSRRALKMSLVNEGLEAKRKDEEAAAKKRKAEEDARWEGAHSLLFSLLYH